MCSYSLCENKVASKYIHHYCVWFLSRSSSGNVFFQSSCRQLKAALFIYTAVVFALSLFKAHLHRMADAETLLMETSDQNGNEEENGQNGAEQELMVGEDSQDNGTDGGKIDASKGEEDAG